MEPHGNSQGDSAPSADGGVARGHLLIVDDDSPLCQRLGKAMARRGFAVEMAESVAEGRRLLERMRPDYAVVDLRLGDGSGLDLVEAMTRANPAVRVVVLTGYG
ncbi:MAG: response regulator, partial [Alphaproteobacteria bacterium]